jgi:hypothetical protein
MSGCCRRNPHAYGVEAGQHRDYSVEQIEAMYANKVISEARYRELLAAPLYSQRANGEPGGPDWMKIGGAAAVGLALIACLNRGQD